MGLASIIETLNFLSNWSSVADLPERISTTRGNFMPRIKRLGALLVLLLICATFLPAQILTTLVNFDYTNGQFPESPLIQGLDGNLYGTYLLGGPDGVGGVFRLTPQGLLTQASNFCGGYNGCAGSREWGIMQTREGTFYGTSQEGGTGAGNMFTMTPQLVGADFADFGDKGGQNPLSAPILGTDGNFWGVGIAGTKNNNSNCDLGCGSIYKVTPEGAVTTEHAFCAQPNCADGWAPVGSLLQASDGNFYGTTNAGGATTGCLFSEGCGTIFKMTLQKVFTTLFTFSGTGSDGGNVWDVALIEGTDGALYGATSAGGLYGGGTVFKITTAGVFTTLYNFCALANCADGSQPQGGLIQASDGNFYGTTSVTGPNGGGTIYRITPAGAFTNVYSFCSLSGCADGSYPPSALFQATDGRIYGVTNDGGTDESGTVFRLNLGLPAFVAPLPGFGKPGQTVSILGNNLKSTTSVTFNGITARFSATSNSAINAIVPSGATSGPIVVTTSTRTLHGQNFQVLP
jgi:uncharacterized repeat protein (TIGR03803 family)